MTDITWTQARFMFKRASVHRSIGLLWVKPHNRSKVNEHWHVARLMQFKRNTKFARNRKFVKNHIRKKS